MNVNARGKYLLLVVCLLLASPVWLCAALPKPVSLDKVLDWQAPFSKSEEQIKSLLYPLKLAASNTTTFFAQGEKVIYPTMIWSPSYNPGYELKFSSGAFKVKRFMVELLDGAVFSYRMTLETFGDPIVFREKVHAHLTTLLQVTPERAGTDGDKPIIQWITPMCRVQLTQYPEGLWISIADPVRKPGPPAALVEAESAKVKVEIDLDEVLKMENLGALTPARLAEIYRPKTEEKGEEPPQFEWLDVGKSRARFSRKMFSDVTVEMTSFEKTVPVEEAVVEFVNGYAARVTVSLYNRGDSGSISPTVFKERFVKSGQALSRIMKVTPKNISASMSSAIQLVSWQWQSPAGIAILEHNEFISGQLSSRPEFLRLKLASPDQADWSMGKLAVGVQRMALTKNITTTPEGDVYVSGVPMVDQGAKGYCVAASCQRLFEYMQIPCDQHEIAQLVNVDAQSGANILEMQKCLTKIDDKYKVAFKPHINPEQYYSGNRKRRISQRQFAIIVKEHVDKGIPLLWALELGRFPEDPPLPGEGQVSGGHMRLIIGYNTAKSQILFSDSWGAGHEHKRMGEAEGYEVTMGVYSMSPPRL